MKLKITSKTERSFFIEMFSKIQDGWKVTQEPKQNIFGTWICRMEKIEPIVNEINLN